MKCKEQMLESINIKLKDHYGRYIPIKYGKIFLTLHFHKDDPEIYLEPLNSGPDLPYYSGEGKSVMDLIDEINSN